MMTESTRFRSYDPEVPKGESPIDAVRTGDFRQAKVGFHQMVKQLVNVGQFPRPLANEFPQGVHKREQENLQRC